MAAPMMPMGAAGAAGARGASAGDHAVPDYLVTSDNGESVLGDLPLVGPQVVGDAILEAVEKKIDVVYVSGKWRFVMLIIKTLPEAVFKKLKF